MSKAASKRDSNYGGITTNNNLEFGGPVGVAALMIWSHYILYYFYYCWESNEGNWIIPMSLDEALSPAWYSGEISKFYGVLCTKCVPGVETWLAYTAFFVVQLVLAAIVPGMMMEGLPTSDGSRYSLTYSLAHSLTLSLLDCRIYVTDTYVITYVFMV